MTGSKKRVPEARALTWATRNVTLRLLLNSIFFLTYPSVDFSQGIKNAYEGLVAFDVIHFMVSLVP